MRLIAGIKDDGNLAPLRLDSDGKLEVAGGSGGGDASAANQLEFLDNLGDKTDAEATDNIGDHSIFSLFKRLLDTYISVINQEVETISEKVTTTNFRVNVTNLELANIVAALSPVTKTPSLISATAFGTVAAGATSISISNNGGAAGTVDGASFPIGAEIKWTANWSNTLDALDYDATGTTFLITEVR